MWHAGKTALHLASCYLKGKWLYIMCVCPGPSQFRNGAYFTTSFSAMVGHSRSNVHVSTSFKAKWINKSWTRAHRDPWEINKLWGINLISYLHSSVVLGLHPAVSENSKEAAWTRWKFIYVSCKGTGAVIPWVRKLVDLSCVSSMVWLPLIPGTITSKALYFYSWVSSGCFIWK